VFEEPQCFFSIALKISVIKFLVSRNPLRNSNVNTYGGGNWASHIKKILEEHVFAYFWTDQVHRLINFSSIKQRIFKSS